MRRSGAERGFSVALGLFALTLALYLFLQSPFFRLEEIELSGSQYFSEAEIMAVGGLRHGQNLFDIDLRDLTARLLAEPVVKDALVRRRLPSGLAVVLTERQPVAAVVADGVLWSLDAEARVLGEVTNPLGLAVIRLPEPLSGLFPGTFLYDPLIRAATGIAADMPEMLALRVVEIRATTVGDIDLVTRDAIMIKLGAWREMDEKIKIVVSLLQQASTRGAQLSVVDVRHPDKPVVR
ncbi:MAG: FtsQ-type POTRA domain-containing protein [Firmicutes bacterium]|nr:FtsQ-type POTRA domain-containing protein [Bacillota bacterium]